MLSILAWEIAWTEERGGLQPLGLQKVVDMTEHTHRQSRAEIVKEGMAVLHFLSAEPVKPRENITRKEPGGKGKKIKNKK